MNYIQAVPYLHLTKSRQGAVFFASILAALSWSSHVESHWSGPALLYAGIVFAFTACILGHQYSFIFPDEDDIGKDEAVDLRKRLSNEGQQTPTPSLWMLFVLQSPLMCLSFAALAFIGGLTAIVLSSWTMATAWNDRAKVCCSPGVVATEKTESSERPQRYILSWLSFALSRFAFQPITIAGFSVTRNMRRHLIKAMRDGRFSVIN